MFKFSFIKLLSWWLFLLFFICTLNEGFGAVFADQACKEAARYKSVYVTWSSPCFCIAVCKEVHLCFLKVPQIVKFFATSPVRNINSISQLCAACFGHTNYDVKSISYVLNTFTVTLHISAHLFSNSLSVSHSTKTLGQPPSPVVQKTRVCIRIFLISRSAQTLFLAQWMR